MKYLDPDGRSEESINGIYAHIAIETWLISEFGGTGEYFIPGGGYRVNTDGFADYVNFTLREIYEIKPISQNQLMHGKVQLQNYIDHIGAPVSFNKGICLFPAIKAKGMIKDVPDGFGGLMDLRLIVFETCPEQAGMIYYEISNHRKLPQRAPVSSINPYVYPSISVDIQKQKNLEYSMGSLETITLGSSSAMVLSTLLLFGL